MSKFLRKPAVAIVGGFLIIAGTIMLVTPGPGLVVIAAGLGVLATEYEWAQRTLHKVREKIRQTERKIRGTRP